MGKKKYKEVFCRFPRKNGWSWKAEGHFVAHIICTWEPSGLDGSVSIFSSPKFSRKTVKKIPPLSPYPATMVPSTMGRRWVAGAWPRVLLGAVLQCAQLWTSGGLKWCLCVIHLLLLQLPVLHMLAPITSTTSVTSTLGESKQLNKLSLTNVVWD